MDQPRFDRQVSQLVEFIENNQPLFVLTGAGCSTESGIPDYRDANGDWKHPKPVQYQQFVQHHSVRQRYWARSMLGWPRISAASPNGAHRALAEMERHDYLNLLVTQNVDGLHRRAGQSRVVELHGDLAWVLCLSCGRRFSRHSIQSVLVSRNPGFTSLDASSAPDGDTRLTGVDLSSFKVPSCSACNGVLKPDVVYFGEAVPQQRVRESFEMLDASAGLLVVGSSLAVYSGFRFCRRAAELGVPIAALNFGKTRADELLDLKLELDCTAAMSEVVARLHQSALH